MQIREFLSRFDGVKKNSSGFQAKCPAHDDRQASLSVSEGREGILLHCHAGCTNDAILQKLGIEYKDLFFNNGTAKQISETYDYAGEDGKLIFQTVRYVPKDFRQRRPDGRGGWIWNLKGIKTILYRLPQVIGAVKDGEPVYVVEGEKDATRLHTVGLCGTTAPLGAGKWRESYNDYFKSSDVVIIPDSDEPGRKHAGEIAQSLHRTARSVKIVHLPADCKDVSIYLDKYSVNDLQMLCDEAEPYTPTENYIGEGGRGRAESEKEPIIDVAQFEEIAANDLVNILELTIKKDEVNKLITFLCAVSAYTNDSQFNVSFNAPSSTGKSYIPTQTAKLFPESDVIEIGYCSPTAFFHDAGRYDKEKNTYTVDLERKILIFLDQPHQQLLERLRPMLSHDKKIITSKITDKTQRGGIRTKNVMIKGYPSVVFCTASLRVDEQEATRFILLSPNTSEAKIRAAVLEKIMREADSNSYDLRVDANPERKRLKDRIVAIRQAGIADIKIENYDKVSEMFFRENPKLRPKHQRDIGRIIAFAKSLALLNLWYRKRDGATIYTNDEDIETAFDIWSMISESQELNIPPYIYDLFREVIKPLYIEKNDGNIAALIGLSRNDIIKEHFKVYGRYVSDWQLRKSIIPILEDSGLIRQEADPSDRRRMLIYLHDNDKNNKGEGGRGRDKDGGELMF